MTLEEVRDRLSAHFDDCEHCNDEITGYYLNDAINTMFAILDYAEKLTDKFGSLEEAMEAEKVVHCRDCGIWRPDKEICNKPCESMKWRRPDDYCSDGRLYERKFMEMIAEKSDLFAREHILPTEEIKAALERSKEVANE